jgi:outer membrane protein OmpA-like peptidoglycan-associated protein
MKQASVQKLAGVVLAVGELVNGGTTFMQRRRTRSLGIVLPILFTLSATSSVAFADDHVRGVVTGRGTDGSLLVRTDNADMVIVINENTKVQERSGLRSIKVDMPSLMPGLRVDVEGTYQTTTQFLAERITFTRDDLKTARDIEAGLTPTNDTVRETRAQIDANQQQNNQRFGQHDLKIASNEQQIVATSGAVEATNARIANLDDYSVVDTLTVYFPNGRSTISAQYETQLRQLADKARTMNGYSVQIEGHASGVGPYSLNQRLSRLRAEAVAALLQQSGVPTTKMFVPAAMGVSDQAAGNTTKAGQAQNRRVVIRVLQNRGITGN